MGAMGATGATGATGAMGATGATGALGAAGAVVRCSCRADLSAVRLARRWKRRGRECGCDIMFVPALNVSTAEVAELADALASGASGSNPIGVQIPASAPTFAHRVFAERATAG